MACLANCATQKDFILRELVVHKVYLILFPQLDDDAKEHYPECDSKLAMIYVRKINKVTVIPLWLDLNGSHRLPRRLP